MGKLHVSVKIFSIAAVNILLLFVLVISLAIVNGDSINFTDSWINILGWSTLFICAVDIFSLRRCGYRFTSFHIIFIIFLYVFMLGRVVLSGVLGIHEVFSEGHMRTVIGLTKVSKHEFTITVLFIFCCIQAVVCGFISKSDCWFGSGLDSDNINVSLYITGLIVLMIGVPCHLINSLRMISLAQFSASYNAIIETSGLIDDFSNFIVPGLFCILFSNKLKKKSVFVLFVSVVLYLFVVMILTGDRRYQAITIVVLVLAYVNKNDIRFSFKHILLVFGGIIMLNIFVQIRQIRNLGLLSLGEFFSDHWNSIFSLNSGFISQSLYEFGVSIYSVAYTIQAIPATSGFRLGATFIRALLMIIPAGFLYQNLDIVKYGGIGSAVEKFSGSAIGAAMIGDLYGNFGFLGGVIAAYVFAIVVRRLISLNGGNSELKYVKYYTLFFSLLHLARASFSEMIRTSVWCVLVVYLVYWVVGGFTNVNKSTD